MKVKQITLTRPLGVGIKMSNTNMARCPPLPGDKEKDLLRKYTLVYLTIPFSS